MRADEQNNLGGCRTSKREQLIKADKLLPTTGVWAAIGGFTLCLQAFCTSPEFRGLRSEVFLTKEGRGQVLALTQRKTSLRREVIMDPQADGLTQASPEFDTPIPTFFFSLFSHQFSQLTWGSQQCRSPVMPNRGPEAPKNTRRPLGLHLTVHGEVGGHIV